MTLHSLLLDARGGWLRGWCCGTPAASGAPPVYEFHLPTFFGTVEDA